jgi:phosphatidylglycerol lysyltransferase
MTMTYPRDTRLQRARELVLAHGWNATSYQIINPGITLWFSAAGDAVVGYVLRHRVRVVAGSPVCAPERLSAVAGEFERDATMHRERVCYFGAESRLEAAMHGRQDHAMVLLGAQPAWNAAHWAGILAHKASLRAQLNRSRNKGVVVAPMAAGEATGNPALQRVLHEWLATRGLPPMHFLVEPETLERLFDRRVFVARRGGEIVAFLVASPAPARGGWLIEQFVRGRGAPNGTVELLLDAAMRAFAAEDYSYVTLGLSPLSRQAQPVPDRNPWWLRALLRWVRAHGRRFYNFEGLEAFKAKFQPDAWEPIYAIENERRFSPSMLYAIAAAFSDGSPISTVARALWKAVWTEAQWLRKRVHS